MPDPREISTNAGQATFVIVIINLNVLYKVTWSKLGICCAAVAGPISLVKPKAPPECILCHFRLIAELAAAECVELAFLRRIPQGLVI